MATTARLVLSCVLGCIVILFVKYRASPHYNHRHKLTNRSLYRRVVAGAGGALYKITGNKHAFGLDDL